MRTLNLWLLCLAILGVLIALIPEPEQCWIPPNAPTRGFYGSCWAYSEIVL